MSKEPREASQLIEEERKHASDQVAALQAGDTSTAAEREHQHAQQQVERAKLIHGYEDIVDPALSHLGLDGLLEELLQRVRSALNVDFSSVLLLDDDGRQLRLRAIQGLEGVAGGEVRIPVGTRFAGHIVSRGKPQTLYDVTPDTVARPYLVERGVKALLGVPMIVEGWVTGVLEVGSLTPRTWSSGDIRLLQLVADRCAVAIDRGRLLEREREAHALLDAVFDASPVGMAVVDPRLRYVRINPPLAAMNGAPVADHLGRTIGEVLGEAAGGLEQVVGRVFTSGAPAPNLELSTPTPAQPEQVSHLVLNFFPVRLNGGSEVRYVGATVLDVTAFKEGQQSLQRATRRLEQAARERTEFFNAVTHELRNPLTPLQLQVELLKDRVVDAESQGALEVIERNLQRLTRLLKELSEVSRLEQGRLKVAKVRMDLAQVVRQACDLHDPEAREAGLDLEARIPPEPVVVEADADRVTQVLSNLLSNAIKFTPAGGQLLVEVRAVAGAVEVRVRDTGPGLTEEQRGRLFQPFSQIHPVATGRRAGTGLGLFVSKGLVEQHGGTMWVESEGAGRGSTFAFRLPLPP